MSFNCCYSTTTAEEYEKTGTMIFNRSKTFKAGGLTEARKLAEAECKAGEFVALVYCA